MYFGVVAGFIGFIGKKKLKREYQRVFNYSNRVVVYFDDFKNELLNLFGKSNHNDSKILVIPNILGDEFSQMENVDFSNKEKLIIYVGRIEDQQKRVDRLVEFWEAFSNKNKEYRLEVLGNGPKFDFYKALINSKKLERIDLVGNVIPKAYYQKATFLVLVSDYEGHALVLTEAQKNGCIPISFRCYSAIDKVIQNGLNGIIVEEFSVNKMVRVFEELTNDQTKINNLQNTVQSVGDYSYPKDMEIVTKWQILINE
jgi:glycosyltransferase involved in cell wall biosynthesis